MTMASEEKSAAADLAYALREAAQRWGAEPAVFAENASLTLGELDRLSEQLALSLRGQGVATGDRIALLCPNGAEFVLLYLALLKAGAVIVPVNLLLSPYEVAFILRDAEATRVIAHPAFADTAEKALGELAATGTAATLVPIHPQADWRRADVLGALLGSSLPATAQAATAVPVSHRSAEPAVILYTSGTTGRPKGAVLTHANLLANARATAAALDIAAGIDRILVVLPMFHAFAATVGILVPLLHGAALVAVARFDPEGISRRIARDGATLFLGVPSLYQALMRLPDERLADWQGVRHCVSGGAALPVRLLESFERRFGIPILEGDGPTECGPVTSVNPISGPRKPGSVGVPLSTVEMRIAAPDGTWLADDAHGEVCVRGPSVMQGYWRQPEATAASFHGDWFRTGDLGYRDSGGYFYLVDRIKDLIIRNGMNVYPRVIEEVLARHPRVAEVAVVGEPDHRHGEVPVAFVVPVNPESTAPVAEGASLALALRSWCREYLGRHEWPKRFEFRESLPRNASGKILKRELRRAGEIERGVDPSRGEPA